MQFTKYGKCKIRAAVQGMRAALWQNGAVHRRIFLDR